MTNWAGAAPRQACWSVAVQGGQEPGRAAEQAPVGEGRPVADGAEAKRSIARETKGATLRMEGS